MQHWKWISLITNTSDRSGATLKIADLQHRVNVKDKELYVWEGTCTHLLNPGVTSWEKSRANVPACLSVIHRNVRRTLGDSRPLLDTTEVIYAFNWVTSPLSLFIMKQTGCGYSVNSSAYRNEGRVHQNLLFQKYLGFRVVAAAPM